MFGSWFGTEKRQAPLAIHLEWCSPPVARGYWQYDITITSDGAAEIVMLPDYPAMKPRPWRRRFTVSPALLVPLTANAASRQWRESNEMICGNHWTMLEVAVNGRLVKIHNNMQPADADAARRMHEDALGLVPEDLLADMERARPR